MGELGFETREVKLDNESNKWAFDLVDVRAVKDRKLSGAGSKVAVIDCQPYPISKSFGLAGEGWRRLSTHGYPIAALIKGILPGCSVRIYGAGTAIDIADAIEDAVRRGFDVISISQRRPTVAKRLESERDSHFSAVAQHAVGRKSAQDFGRSLRDFRQAEREIARERVGLPFLDRAVKKAHDNHVTLIAASGYPWTDRGEKIDDTFGYYPEAIVVGAVNKELEAVKHSPKERVDIWAPGEGIKLPAGSGYMEYMFDHSIAAPFVAVACALTTSLLGKDEARTKKIILETSRKIGGVNVVDYGFLMKRIEGELYYRDKQ